MQATRGPAASGSVVLLEGVQVLGVGQEDFRGHALHGVSFQYPE